MGTQLRSSWREEERQAGHGAEEERGCERGVAPDCEIGLQTGRIARRRSAAAKAGKPSLEE